MKWVKHLFCLLATSTASVMANHLSSLDVEEVIKEYMADKGYEQRTELCDIMTRCGSDKGSGHHNYTTLYAKIFEHYFDKELNIFELGLGTNYLDISSNMGASGVPGASLWGWSLYFSNSQIYGADIDKRILFSTPRIATYYCDQRSTESINQMYQSEGLSDLFFDVIIDDGLHRFDANYTFLVNSIFRLKKNGIFIVEDLLLDTAANFRQCLPALKKEYKLRYIEVIEIPNIANSIDNVLLVIQK